MLAACVLLGANLFFTLGMFNEVGLSAESPALNPSLKALFASFVLSGTGFAAMLSLWKAGKVPVNFCGAILFFAYAYLGLIAAMAFFRLQTIETIIGSI